MCQSQYLLSDVLYIIKYTYIRREPTPGIVFNILDYVIIPIEQQLKIVHLYRNGYKV